MSNAIRETLDEIFGGADERGRGVAGDRIGRAPCATRPTRA